MRRCDPAAPAAAAVSNEREKTRRRSGCRKRDYRTKQNEQGESWDVLWQRDCEIERADSGQEKMKVSMRRCCLDTCVRVLYAAIQE